MSSANGTNITSDRTHFRVILRVLLFGEFLGPAQCLKNLLSIRIRKVHRSQWKGAHIHDTYTCLHGHLQISKRAQASMPKTTKHKVMNPAGMPQTYTSAHTLTEGVRAICGPSHASPEQRCLLAVGVIIGHAGLFLCQRKPCQEMITEHSDGWLAQQQHTYRGILYVHIHHKKVQLGPSLLITGAFTLHSSERVNRIEEAATPERKPHFFLI